MNNNEHKTHASFYFVWGVICAVLVCLKLTHVISWSWALVLAPFYIPASIIVIIVIVVVAIILSKEYTDK